MDNPLNRRFWLDKGYPHATSTAAVRFGDDVQDKGLLDPHIDRFYFFAPFCAGKRVLDLGCGFGYGTKIMSQWAREIVGIDLDPNEIEYARKWHSGKNISYLVSAVEDLLMDEFDVVVCTEVLEHVPEEKIFSLLAAARKRMTRGGLAIFTTPCQRETQKTGNQWHVKEYSHGDFLALLQPHFAPFAAWFYDWRNATMSVRPQCLGLKGVQSFVVQAVLARPRL